MRKVAVLFVLLAVLALGVGAQPAMAYSGQCVVPFSGIVYTNCYERLPGAKVTFGVSWYWQKTVYTNQDGYFASTAPIYNGDELWVAITYPGLPVLTTTEVMDCWYCNTSIDYTSMALEARFGYYCHYANIYTHCARPSRK